MNLPIISPYTHISTKIVTDRNGRSFEVCYAIVNLDGCLHARVLGVRPCEKKESLKQGIKRNILAISGNTDTQSPYVEECANIFAEKLSFLKDLSFIISQPTRAPDMC